MGAVHRLVICLLTSLVLASSLADTRAAASLSTDIEPQPLADALTAFGEQTGLQLFYLSAITHAVSSRGASAGMAPAAALRQLLEGTGLKFEFINSRAVRIFGTPAPAAPSRGERRLDATPGPKSRSEATPVALAEVIVTATQREQQLSRVPMSIAVWTLEAMQASGARTMADIAFLTPGAEFDYFPEFGAALQANIAIRGVTSRNGTTTAIFLDDTPLPAPGDWGGRFGRAFPVTFDLDRVEVLRGPQGALFGSGAMGGAVRFISRQPNLSDFDGLVQTDIATTAGGAGTYEVSAAAGGPIVTDSVGFRLSASYRSEGGYVDRVNPSTKSLLEANANRSSGKSLRGAMTIAPTDSLRVTSSLLYHSAAVHDSGSFQTYLSNANAGVLRNAKWLRQPYDDSYYLASLKFSVDFLPATLTAVSSYFNRTAAATVDATNYNYGGWGDTLLLEYPCCDDWPTRLAAREIVFSEEARLASASNDSPLDWIAGLYYSRARSQEADTTIVGHYNPYGPIHDAIATAERDSQFAAFGHASLKLTKQLTASAGARLSWTNFDALETDSTLGTLGSVTFLPPVYGSSHSETSATPDFGLEYRWDDDGLVFATAAKGTRPGGANWPFGVCPAMSRQAHRPDSLWSYELGAKDTLAAGRVQLSGSLFYIQWNKPPGLDSLTESTCRYLGNPADVVSRGFDLALQGLVTDRLKVSLAYGYARARYTETATFGVPYPAGPVLYTIAREGDSIGVPPVVPPPWSLRGALAYSRLLGPGLTATLNAEEVYHSRVKGPFDFNNTASVSFSPGLKLDRPTNMLNGRVGLSWRHVAAQVYINNALNSQPTLLQRFGKRNPINFNTYYATTFRPRTVGLSGSWRFD